jgi:hypothetical protein
VAKEKRSMISMPASMPPWESEGFKSIAGSELNFPIDQISMLPNQFNHFGCPADCIISSLINYYTAGEIEL